MNSSPKIIFLFRLLCGKNRPQHFYQSFIVVCFNKFSLVLTSQLCRISFLFMFMSLSLSVILVHLTWINLYDHKTFYIIFWKIREWKLRIVFIQIKNSAILLVHTPFSPPTKNLIGWPATSQRRLITIQQSHLRLCTCILYSILTHKLITGDLFWLRGHKSEVWWCNLAFFFYPLPFSWMQEHALQVRNYFCPHSSAFGKINDILCL